PLSLHDALPIYIGNTILKAAASGVNLEIGKLATVTSHGYNLSSDDGAGYLNGPGDQINTDPMIGSLQDNGGPTFTHALLPGSPAIDAGGPHFAPPSMWAHLKCRQRRHLPQRRHRLRDLHERRLSSAEKFRRFNSCYLLG